MNEQKCMLRSVRILPFLLVAALAPARAQVSPLLYDYPRPGLDWYNVETEHFNVLFHADSSGAGASRTARVVARIAEDVYGPITSFYGHEPEKVTFVLKDYEDYSNGAAYFFDNKIEIWAPALDSPLRGDHNWLRNVITHEFTHIVQVQASIKGSRKMPFYYFQLLDYEDVKRPDVLYGYPDVIVTYPVPVLSNPAWLAEGTAQYQRAFLHYDRWDSHRDMLLRTRVLAGEELSLAEMGGFYSHSSLLREGVYNHGFAFTRYLARTYGEDVLPRLTRALGKWKNWNVDRAFKDAVGKPGKEVHREWIDTLRKAYEANTAAVRAHLVEGRLVEEEGFSNFYPAFSPDGKRLAYVSNRGEHFNLMSLYVRDLETGTRTAIHLDGLQAGDLSYTCSMGHTHPVKRGVGGAVAWRPDGQAIVYARAKDTPEGYLYSDLYELDLATKKSKRLTTDRRASHPAYAADGSALAFVAQADGTTNLYRLDVATGDVTPLTNYRTGEQVSDPAWHPSGEWIYFALAHRDGRDLYRVRAAGGTPEAVLATDADERSPAFDPEGLYLYFASDESGIFNLYRMPVDTAAGGIERLTNVLGGAFMPAVSADGALAFAQYQWDGYKIAMLDDAVPVPEEARLATYTSPEVLQKEDAPQLAQAPWVHLNDFDDRDLGPLPGEAVTAVHTVGRFPLTPADSTVAETTAVPEQAVEGYKDIFTPFTFFPVVRLDQYVSRQSGRLDARLGARSRLETLARNTKVGVYMSSREVKEEMSLLGGLMFGPASYDSDSPSDFFSPSRLLKLERDAFLIFEYKKGLPFIPKRWSPQFAVEMYNIRRNVENGLSIEEFPCTACYPDTSFANLSYSLWEADLFARSKLTRSLMLELGFRYSPYRVTTERFFSTEAQDFIPESASRYYIGRGYSAKLYFEGYRPHRHDDVLREGLRLEAGYDYEQGRLLDRFDIENGMLVPVYEQSNNHRLTLDVRTGLRLPGTVAGGSHGLGFRLRATTILGKPVDDFYNDYVGGLIGARGYPFYALGGNETLWFQTSYLLPILPDLRKQILFAYFDKLYARVYADAALAWSGALPGLDQLRKDVGAELRLGLGSFYLLPTALFVSATYGLDSFDFQLDEGFVTPDGKNTVRYGGELLWHFGVLFEFDL